MLSLVGSLLAALTLSGASSRPSTTPGLWIVDAGGQGDYAEIQAAIDAAQSGDVILVRNGAYGEIVLDAKALTITAEPTALVTTGAVLVRNQPAGSTTSLGGLRVLASGAPALSLSNSQGSIHVLDCLLIGGSGRAGGQTAGWPGLSLESAQDVVLVRAEAWGGADAGVDDYGAAAGEALLARDSRIAAYHSLLQGGHGAHAQVNDGGHGGAGARLETSFLYAELTTIRGGNGGDGHRTATCGIGGNGGVGLSLQQSSHGILRASSTTGGLRGECDEGILCNDCTGTAGPDQDVSLDSLLENLAGDPRSFDLPPAHVSGFPLIAKLAGQAGDRVFLGFSSRTGFHYLPGAGGVSVLGGPGYLRTAPITTLTSSAEVEIAIDLPLLPPGALSVLHYQGLFRPVGGPFLLGTPGDLVLLRCETGIDCDGDSTSDLCGILNGSITDCNADRIPDTCQVDCNGNGVPDDCDLASGTSTDCNSNAIPDDCEVDCNANGRPDDCDIADGSSQDLNGNGVPDECDPSFQRIYVDAAHVGASDGSSWALAFANLQVALAAASSSDANEIEVWVARGTYRPAPPGGDQEASFQLPARTKLYGGFAGGETDLAQRDVEGNPTILSGDLLGNDTQDLATHNDNSYTVVLALAQSGLNWIDGFTIRDAYWPETYYFRGHGMVVLWASAHIENCCFTANIGREGAGLEVIPDSGTTVLVHACSFIGNRTTSLGGGLHITGGTVSDCLFVGNDAQTDGGGLWCQDTTVVSSLFHSNIATRGGAIFGSGQSRFYASTIASNVSPHSGTFARGAGIFLRDYDAALPPQVHDCVLYSNVMLGLSDEAAQLGFQPPQSPPIVSYCDIQGLTLFAGNHNLASDPLFVDPDGADGIAGTLDDDYRLGPGSPCIDSGRNSVLPRDVDDLDHDGNTTELWPLDLDLLPRFQDDPNVPDTGSGQGAIVDRGCYERSGAP